MLKVADARARRSHNGKGAMPQDGSVNTVEGVQKLADHPRRQKLYTLDFSKPLKWNTPEDGVGEFYYLVEHPPLHSVVVHIGPKMAEWLLTNTNNHNRPKVETHASRLGRKIATPQEHQP